MRINLVTIKEASKRIGARIHETPVLSNKAINDIAGATLYFKCENFQKTGSFKIRGATNAVFSLTKEEIKILEQQKWFTKQVWSMYGLDKTIKLSLWQRFKQWLRGKN